MQCAKVTFGDWTTRLDRYTQDSLTDALDRKGRADTHKAEASAGSPFKRFGKAWDTGWSALATSKIAARKWFQSHPVEVEPFDLSRW